MFRLDPFDIHTLIPIRRNIPSNVVWAVKDAFHRALADDGRPLSRDEDALLDGLIRVTYLQSMFDGHKPSISELLKICGQAASDQSDSGFGRSLMLLGAKLARAYAYPSRAEQLQA
jgi:hypothetical protein